MPSQTIITLYMSKILWKMQQWTAFTKALYPSFTSFTVFFISPRFLPPFGVCPWSIFILFDRFFTCIKADKGDQTENTVVKHDCILGQRSNNTWPSKQDKMANEAIILWQVTYAAEKKPGQDFAPMINLLFPTTLQPTFRTDPIKGWFVSSFHSWQKWILSNLIKTEPPCYRSAACVSADGRLMSAARFKSSTSVMSMMLA